MGILPARKLHPGREIPQIGGCQAGDAQPRVPPGRMLSEERQQRTRRKAAAKGTPGGPQAPDDGTGLVSSFDPQCGEASFEQGSPNPQDFGPSFGMIHTLNNVQEGTDGIFL